MKRIQTLPLIISLFAVLAAGSPCRTEQSITATVPPELDLKASEIEMTLVREGVKCPAGSSIALAVYYYSESVEEIAYSDTGMTSSVKPGRIKVLLKYRTGKKLKKVYFLEALGINKREILDNLARKVLKALS